MKKRYLLLILVLVLATVVTGCAGNDKSDKADEREEILFTGGEAPTRAPALGDKDTVIVVDDKIQPHLDAASEMEEWDVEPFFDELLAEGKVTEEEHTNLITAYYFNIPEGQ